MKLMKIVTKISAAVVMSVSMSAHAGAILDWEGTGVDFFSTWLDADTLRIEIDAGSISPGSGWDGAVNIDSIAINAPDSWSWVNAGDIMLAGPGSFGGPVDGTGLNASGCKGLNLGSNHPCWTGLAALTDNMFFDFSFQGNAVISSQTDSPHLKVRFVDKNGGKVGSLLSAPVPEPSVIFLMGVGLVGLGFTCRRRARKA